jgi:NitT/TauT family transport system permease protein
LCESVAPGANYSYFNVKSAVPERPKPAMSSAVRFMRRSLAPIAILILWQVAVDRWHFGSGFVPSPSEVAQTALIWMFDFGSNDRFAGGWLPAVIASSERVALGFFVASLIGLVMGTLIGRSRLAADLLDPLVQILRPIPVSAWVPFSLVFFGIGASSAVFLVALGAFFPVVLNSVAGVRHVALLHLRSARMLGASRTRLLFLVILPSALPSIFVGLRLALGLSWVLLIVAEMVAVKSGLGYELWNAYYYNRMDLIVAAMLTIGLLGFATDQLLLWLSQRLLRWRETTET